MSKRTVACTCKEKCEDTGSLKIKNWAHLQTVVARIKKGKKDGSWVYANIVFRRTDIYIVSRGWFQQKKESHTARKCCLRKNT